ncbi:MAG: alpha/beta hydrolase [Crocinitomicaceae bacterium]
MKDLVLIHGALGASCEFEVLKNHLKEDFNVFSFDLEGHGQSKSEKPFSMHLFADNLRSFIRENNLQQPQIFGFSMGGYTAYHLAKEHLELLGDIMSLGSKLKWDPLTAKVETGKMNPEKIKEKVPKFAAYLSAIHLDWELTMNKTVDLMINLGNGDAMTFEDFGKIPNKCFIGLADGDEMVSCQETLDVDAALLNSHYYKLPNSRHPFPQLNMKQLSEYIIKFLA